MKANWATHEIRMRNKENTTDYFTLVGICHWRLLTKLGYNRFEISDEFDKVIVECSSVELRQIVDVCSDAGLDIEID